MNRETRAEKAEKHTIITEKYFKSEIDKCIDTFSVYNENSVFPPLSKNKFDTEIILECLDSVSAVYKYKNEKCALLNFASFKKPGGGFITGAIAQEEAICHQSWLYNVLASPKAEAFYANNRKDVNKCLYHNRAVYIKDVGFMNTELNESNGEKYVPVLCDVLTCAAPNRGAALKNGISESDNDTALISRIKFVLDIFAENNGETIITGAFGCGVFRQNAYRVTEIFLNYLDNEYKGVFKKVVFAIPDEKGTNYIKCRSCMSNSGHIYS